MRPAIAAAAAAAVAALGAACVSDVEDGSFGRLSSSPLVSGASATEGYINYGMIYHWWKINLNATPECNATTIATFEINTPPTGSALPLGPIPFRAAESPMAGEIPSAYLRYGTNTITTGTITIDLANATHIVGSIDAQAIIDGTPTTLTGAFDAYVCAAPP